MLAICLYIYTEVFLLQNSLRRVISNTVGRDGIRKLILGGGQTIVIFFFEWPK